MALDLVLKIIPPPWMVVYEFVNWCTIASPTLKINGRGRVRTVWSRFICVGSCCPIAYCGEWFPLHSLTDLTLLCDEVIYDYMA